MTSKIDFKELSESIAVKQRQENMLPVIEKELLHYEILTAMDKSGLLNNIVFQGGTSLRLCYGSERYSEDLDFAAGLDFNVSDAKNVKDIIEHAISNRYDVEVKVKEPKQRYFETDQDNKQQIEVVRWQIQVVTLKGRPDIPQQRIKLELAQVPAHTRTVKQLFLNYDELPSGYRNTLIPVESLSEIMADKLVSLAVAKGIRYRDIWDLRWISTFADKGDFNIRELVEFKLDDYGVSDFQDKKSILLERLPEIIASQEFQTQMQRFLTSSVLGETIKRPIFREHLLDQLKSLYKIYT